MWTISWEEAMAREVAYQQKLKMLKLLPADFKFATIPDPESPSKPITTKKKRKNLSDNQLKLHGLQEQPSTSKSFEDPVPQPETLDDLWSEWEQLTISQHPPKRFKGKALSKTFSAVQQSPHLTKRTLKHSEMVIQKSISEEANWCHVCKVKCLNNDILRQHCEVKRHKDNLETYGKKKRVLANVNYIWCRECNVPCSNQRSMDEHLVGKKHLARIAMLASENAGGTRAARSLKP